MRKIKTETGITLISLVITITILLIFGIVAIVSIRDNNIIAYANNAAMGYEGEKDTESSMLSGYENVIKEFNSSSKEENKENNAPLEEEEYININLSGPSDNSIATEGILTYTMTITTNANNITTNNLRAVLIDYDSRVHAPAGGIIVEGSGLEYTITIDRSKLGWREFRVMIPEGVFVTENGTSSSETISSSAFFVGIVLPDIPVPEN